MELKSIYSTQAISVRLKSDIEGIVILGSLHDIGNLRRRDFYLILQSIFRWRRRNGVFDTMASPILPSFKWDKEMTS